VFDTYFKSELERLSQLDRDALIELGSREIRLTYTGRIFARTVAQIFDAFSTAPIASMAV
jgi:hypothetical protein